MRKYYPFQTNDEANGWLTGLLLNRSAAVSDRLFHTTRLCDLIFSALAFENDFERKENNPVSPDALCADLFTLLFSPVIRRKDSETIRLRERLFHQPIADRLLGNDRFKDLKSLCEDIPPEEQRVFAAVFLTSVDSKEYFDFGYKAMDESYGPCYFDCPKAILKLLSPTDCEYAINWRKKCSETYEEKHRLDRLPIGTVIEFSDGEKTVRLEKHKPAYQFKAPFWWNGTHYYKKSRIPSNFTVVRKAPEDKAVFIDNSSRF